MATLKDYEDSGTKAEEMAKAQRHISIAEFFEKNRHLLGFDNKRKALLTTIKEAVDNSLDACEEAEILPEISVEIIDMGSERFRIIVEDNGPGIVKKQIPNIFGKLLYGSKFHTLKQQRGQQGIGISAAALYGQLTTGRPIKIMSKISKKHDSNYYELHINTQTNQPKITKEQVNGWDKNHGTRIELDIEASYVKGDQSVDEYLKETAIINPHVTIIYTNPKAEQFIFPRATEELPIPAKEIKPHPYGVELGILLKMLHASASKTMLHFFQNEFSRVGAQTTKDILQKAALLPNTKPNKVQRPQAEKLIKAIRDTKIMSPPTNCLSPIGAEFLEKGLRKEINAEFFASVSRAPSVYRGNPFIVEAVLAYGGELDKEGSIKLMRFANRVPLLYQQGSCATSKSVLATSWRNYGLSQSRGSLPQGPMVLVVHIASVWAPFTSEAKEAIAHYPEIMKEVKLALQEVGRQLGKYVNKKKKVSDELKKKSYIEMYIPYVAEALKEILQLSKIEEDKIQESLKSVLEQTRKVPKIKKAEIKEEDGREKLGLNLTNSNKDNQEEDKNEE